MSPPRTSRRRTREAATPSTEGAGSGGRRSILRCGLEGETLVERLEYLAPFVKEVAPGGVVIGNAGVEVEIVIPAGRGDRVERSLYRHRGPNGRGLTRA
jgi:hypothetical protein